MSESKFEAYNSIINELVTESIQCSPKSWDEGCLTIDCDGTAINYSLKNQQDSNRASISEALRYLCEKLYVVMRQNGDVWSRAVVNYFKKGEGWGMNLSFDYPNDSDDAAETATDVNAPSAPQEQHDEVTRVVNDFIVDYFEWNQTANELCDFDADYSEENMDVVEQKYDDLINKYCPPGHSAQPIAFGSESSHDPAREEIKSVRITGKDAIVETVVRPADSDSSLSDNYEFTLLDIDGKWYLTSVCVVIDGERYESL